MIRTSAFGHRGVTQAGMVPRLQRRRGLDAAEQRRRCAPLRHHRVCRHVGTASATAIRRRERWRHRGGGGCGGYEGGEGCKRAREAPVQQQA